MNILLVEDENGIGRFITRGLRKRGWQVHWERIGQNVPRLAMSGRFNAVIMDLLLPDQDGLDLCRHIRKAEVGVPILILTARTQLDDRIDGLASGADDYLGKPFEFRDLLSRLEALARRDRSRKPDPINLDRLRVDPNSSTATWDGHVIEATGRTFTLLFTLARARGEVVDRDELIDTIWGSEASITDNALDVCASSLRRKLASVTNELAVESVRGLGYALRVCRMIA